MKIELVPEVLAKHCREGSNITWPQERTQPEHAEGNKKYKEKPDGYEETIRQLTLFLHHAFV